MLLLRDLMPRKWILQVGSVPPSALTSPAHQPMQLVSKHMGNSKERVPCPVVCRVAFGSLSHACLFTRAFHLWQRMKNNTACAKILFVSFLILLYSCYCCYSPKWIGFVLGAIFVIKTCATLNYSEILVTVGSHSYWKLHCSSLTVTGWPPVFWGFFDIWWYFIFAGHTFFLLEEGAL